MSAITATAIPDTRKKPAAQTIALIIGALGLGVALVGLIMGVSGGDSRLVQSWLLGFSYWYSIAIGMLFLIQLFYMFDAGWAVVVRRQLEHAVSVFPWLGLIFLPLILVSLFGENPGILWKWMNPEGVYPGGHEIAHDPLWIHKAGYLNQPFFVVRAIVYFGVFCLLSGYLRKWSYAMDSDPDPKYIHRSRKLSAAGLFLTAFAATFAGFDWYMSLSYHWFSTMYGVWFFAVSMRVALAATVVIYFLQTRKGGQLEGLHNPTHTYFLGCLMLAFTIFWAYISFSQYFLIYNANIPEETFWYNLRELNPEWAKNSWWWLTLYGLIGGFFLVPFFYLLWYKNKFGGRVLFIACWVLFFALADFYFNIMPAKYDMPEAALGYGVKEFKISIFDISMLIGVGGICVWSFLRSSLKAKIVPIHDPRINESIHAGH